MTGRRLFKRIYRGYGVVVLAFTILFGICACVGVYVNAREDFEANGKDVLWQISSNLDSSLYDIQYAWEQLANDESVRAYLADENQNTYLGVQDAIKTNSERFSEDKINIYVSKLSSSFDKIISKSHVVGAYDFLRTYQYDSGSSDGIRQYFTKSENYGHIFANYCVSTTLGNATLFIVDKKKIDGIDLYTIATVDISSISEFITRQGGSFAVMYGQNMICNVGVDTFKTRDVINNVLKKHGATISGSTTFVDDAIYISGESDVYKWNYILSYPSHALKQNMIQGFFTVLALCCVVVLASMGLLLLLTRWVYRPLNETVKFVSRYGGEAFSDEALFIRQSFVHMSNEKNEAAQKLDDAKGPLKIKFLRDLLFGLVNGEDLTAHISEIGAEEILGPYRVVLLKLVDYELLFEAFSKESIDKIKNQIKEFIDYQLEDQVIYGAIDIDQSTIAVISYGRELRELRETLIDMAMMVEGGFDVEMAISIGEDCDTLGDIADAYISSCFVMENRFSLGSYSAVVTQEDLNAANTDGIYYPIDIERELITEVIRARSVEVHRILEIVFEENFVRRTLSREKTNAFVFAITASVNRIIESLNKTAEDVFGEGNIIFLELKMCNAFEERKAKIYEIFDRLISYVNIASKLEQDNLADLMLEYIHSHYNEDISLLDMSGYLDLSQCYTSTLFKEATGENFKDYLSRYRIKMAKQILEKEPGIKNNELARRIGCNTVATLFRLFNKYEGTSPGQYIKTIKE